MCKKKYKPTCTLLSTKRKSTFKSRRLKFRLKDKGTKHWKQILCLNLPVHVEDPAKYIFRPNSIEMQPFIQSE